jgi:tRNA nucleotidyltransferase (CCA-adding enzyme)
MILQTAYDLAQSLSAKIMLVGGAVRSLLLGEEVHDYDLAVQGDTVKLGRMLANKLHGAFYVMDAERGTVRVIMNNDIVDLAQCRGETWEEDLLARDFCVNAIGIEGDHFGKLEALLNQNLRHYISKLSLLIYDPLDGLNDLNHRIIRMCTPTAIAEDQVRALRAVRMAVTLKATLVAETETAVRKAQLINPQLSVERVRDELMKMLALPNAKAAVQSLSQLGLIQQIIKGVSWNEHYWANAVFEAPQHLPVELLMQLREETANERTRLSILRLAVWARQLQPVQDALSEIRRLRLSNDEMYQIRSAVIKVDAAEVTAQTNHPDRERALYRLVRELGRNTPEVLWLVMLRDPKLNTESLITRYYQHYAPLAQPAPLIVGGDLMAMNIAPGPIIGVLLEAVREAQMIGEIHTHTEAMAFAEHKLATLVKKT